MVIISLQSILTSAEYRVRSTDEGLLNIKQTRSESAESGEQDLDSIIFKITDIKVMSLHSDLSTITNERIIIFKLEDNLERHI